MQRIKPSTLRITQNGSVVAVLFFGLLITIIAWHMVAKQDLASAKTALPYRPVASQSGFDSRVVRVAALNYSTFAADLLWISTIVNFSELRDANRQNKDLLKLGYSLADLDPRLYSVYPWVTAAYLSRNSTPSEAELADVNGLLRIGMKVFTQDFYLPYSAGLNYIGYSSGASKQRRIREIRDGISLLMQAVSLPGAHNLVNGVIGWFRRRLAILEGREISREQFLTNQLQLMSQTHVPRVRSSILESLTAHGIETDYVKNFERARFRELLGEQAADGYAYLPPNLWLLVRND